MPPILQVLDIHKSYDNLPLLRGVSLDIARGEIVCLLGPSGSGKTTLLRIIAGLEEAESGAVIFDGQDMLRVPVHQRSFGLMFQDLALFPHRDVFSNVAFGLDMQNSRKSEIEKRVRELLELVGLKKLGERDVNHLSGGEQQRVALARALAPQPRLLMLDEPLGALDRILREQLVDDLRAILKRLHVTSLYVTHDQNEAFAIADHVFIIHEGIVAQSGTPHEVYDHPASAFVARFLGMENLLRGRLTSTSGQVARVETAEGVFAVNARDAINASKVNLLIRPDAARSIATNALNASENVIEGSVIESRLREGRIRVSMRSRAGSLLTFDWSDELDAGQQVWIKLDPSKIMILKE